MLSTFLLVLGALVLAQLSPGPNLMAVAGAALGQGRRAAGFVVLGISTAIFIWVSLAALGLGAVLAAAPSLLVVMKLAGGAYLLWLGARALRSALRGGMPAIAAETSGWTPLGAWRRGLLVNLTNPKSALTWAAVATVLFGAGASTGQVLAFAPMGAASACLIYGGYGVLFSTGAARRLYARFSRAADAMFGAAFGAIGGRLVWDGVRDVAR